MEKDNSKIHLRAFNYKLLDEQIVLKSWILLKSSNNLFLGVE